MRGTDEAKYAFMALNILLNNDKTSVLVEMGGRSAQIAFEVKNVINDKVHEIYLDKKRFVYLDSYAGCGKDKALEYLRPFCTSFNNLCKKTVEKFVNNFINPKIQVPSHKNVYAISSFHTRR